MCARTRKKHTIHTPVMNVRDIESDFDISSLHFAGIREMIREESDIDSMKRA